jgi:hypothetical protein
MSSGLSAGAIIGIAGAAASVGSAVISSQGAQSAANTQANAQNNATAEQQQMFNTIVGQEQPCMQAGGGALSSLNQLLGLTSSGAPTGGLPNGYLTQTTGPFSFNPSSITSSPAYQFAQQQGLNAVANNEAPNVGAMSGPALKALTNFSTGTAEQYYNDYFNQAQSQYSTNLNAQMSQQQNIFSRLSAIAGLGQNAASNTGTAGTQLGTGIAQSTAAAGGSLAAGQVGSANALGSGFQGAGNAYALSSILNNNGFGGGGSGASADAGVPGWTPAQGGS